MKIIIQQYFLKDDGIYPNSVLPVLLYKKVLQLPFLFPASAVLKLFRGHNWTNNWRGGIYEYHHYHSMTHEVMGVIKGSAKLQLGGDDGIAVTIEAGDVIIIPAGVAHKNLGKENSVTCIGGYPDGKDFDLNFGWPLERPRTDRNIAMLPLPATDPVAGSNNGLTSIWKNKVMVL